MSDQADGLIPDGEPVSGSPLRRRKRTVLVVAAAAVLLAVGGLVGATFIKSPAELAAEQQPPAPTVLTAKVVRQAVSDTLVLRGTVRAAQEFQVTPTAGEGAAAPVVTAIRKSTGDAVLAGEVVVEVSGRPLIALHGATPAFRDLRPGSTGPDVRQLQEALAELGFRSSPDKAGTFAAGTKKAVRDFYAKLGFDAPTTGGPDGQDQAELQAAQDAVTQAQRRLRDAREATVPSPHQIEDATADLRAAQQRLATLDASTGPMMPRSEVVFLPSFPARVSKLNGRIGGEVQPPLVTLAAGTLEVAGRLDPADRSLVRTDVPAEIDSESTGMHATGKVSAIGDTAGQAAPTQPGSGGQADQAPAYLPVTITPDAPLDPKLIGQDVRLTLRFAQTAGEVLAVPQAAISSSADGRTYVTRIGSDGGTSRVEVRAGVSGNGLVEVTPVAGDLAAGDTVVTGT